MHMPILKNMKTNYSPRVLSGWAKLSSKTDWLMALVLLSAMPVFSETFYIQSRTSTGTLITGDPPYKEVAGTWGSSGSGSTQDPTTGLGSRFASGGTPVL